MNKLSDDEFFDCFAALQNKIPTQILKEYVESSKGRLKSILLKENKIPGMHWLV